MRTPIAEKHRLLFYRFSQSPFLGFVSEALYRYAAKGCAKSLSAVPGIDSAFLKASSLDDCAPGISDLDFLLFYRPELSDPEKLSLFAQIAAVHKKCKKTFPMLGELLVLEASPLDPHPHRHTKFVPLHQSYRYVPAQKDFSFSAPSSDVPDEVWFHFACGAYRRLFGPLGSLRTPFAEIRINRSLRTALRLSRREFPNYDAGPEGASPATLLALCLHRIEVLARGIDSPPPTDELEFDEISFGAAFKPFDFIRRQLADRAGVGREIFDLRPLGSRQVLGLKEDVPFPALVRLLERYLSGPNKESAFPPVAPWPILGPVAFRRLNEGFSRGLNDQYFFGRGEKPQLTNLKSDRYFCQQSALGTFLSDTPERGRRILGRLCEVSFMIATRLVTADQKKLWAAAAKYFPQSVKLAQTLFQKKQLGVAELAKGYLDLQNEYVKGKW